MVSGAAAVDGCRVACHVGSGCDGIVACFFISRISRLYRDVLHIRLSAASVWCISRTACCEHKACMPVHFIFTPGNGNFPVVALWCFKCTKSPNCSCLIFQCRAEHEGHASCKKAWLVSYAHTVVSPAGLPLKHVTGSGKIGHWCRTGMQMH